MRDYKERTYLSSTEAAKFLNCDMKLLRSLIKSGRIPFQRAASGQYRLSLEDLKSCRSSLQNNTTNIITPGFPHTAGETEQPAPDQHKDLNSPDTPLSHSLVLNAGCSTTNIFEINNTTQKIIIGDSRDMKELEDESVHLMVTSPPYFNAKMYSEELTGDLGNIHDLDEWFREIGKTWREVHRVLQPGRKAFINIMNLPVRTGKTFRTLNLTGRTIDLMEEIGFIFKRDIVWHKTNGVKAHFGTYPYPGGILINNMHEFILEFHKPDLPGRKKYAHVTPEQREASKLDKDFWLSLKNSDVWLMNPQQSSGGRDHVAPFPHELPYRIIKAYSFQGETVLDPFGGSLATMEVAAELGRNGIAYEINGEMAVKGIGRLFGKGEMADEKYSESQE